MERRTNGNRARLNLERLDERIVPSHGQSNDPTDSLKVALEHLKRDLEDEPRSLKLFLSALTHDLQELVSAANKIKDDSHGHGNAKHADRDPKGNDDEDRGNTDPDDSPGKPVQHNNPSHGVS